MVQDVCIPKDPLISDMVCRPIEEVSGDWYDPIMSNDLAGHGADQFAQTSNANCSPVPGANAITQVGGENILGSIPIKRPRGRPRKLIQTQCELQPVDHCPPRSVLEAVATWKTAELLGISATDEGAVIEGLRKSKRLLLLDKESH